MRYLPAVIVDIVLVLVFAAIGRASHEEDPAGFLLTAWPFLIALLLGHLLAALLPGRPRRPWSVLWGAVVWVVTVAGGMLIRVLSGDTAEAPFIVVASIVLGLFLVGWRAVAAVLRRVRTRTPSAAMRSDDDPSGADDAGDSDRRVAAEDDAAESDVDPGDRDVPPAGATGPDRGDTA